MTDLDRSPGAVADRFVVAARMFPGGPLAGDLEAAAVHLRRLARIDAELGRFGAPLLARCATLLDRQRFPGQAAFLRRLAAVVEVRP